jgi:hyperosmotically inducible protein
MAGKRRQPFFHCREEMNMKIRLAQACFVAGALMLPVLGHGADSDSDRSHPKAFAKDSWITTKIKADLVKAKDVSATHIKVDTDDKGIVTLSGTARTQAEADKAVSIARDVKGVVAVENNIKVSNR